MADGRTKPVIFISYSHKDEPDHPRGDEVAWLSFVRDYLQPALKDGVFDLVVDTDLLGGDDLDREIEARLRACDVFLLLVSAHSMGSDYIRDKEVPFIRKREADHDDVRFYPLLLTPTPKIALNDLKAKIIRPRNGKPLSSFNYNDRLQEMSDIADEIWRIRKIRVSIRVQASREDLRGSGSDFDVSGKSKDGKSYVPDYKMNFEVAPRNLNLTR